MPRRGVPRPAGGETGAQYVGGHPYPKVGNNTGTVQRWELAAPYGGDSFDTRAGPGTSNANGSKTYAFHAPPRLLLGRSGPPGGAGRAAVRAARVRAPR